VISSHFRFRHSSTSLFVCCGQDRFAVLDILLSMASRSPNLASMPDAAHASDDRLCQGSTIELIGLQMQNHLNGRVARLRKFHDEKGRWELRVGGNTLLVKPENIRNN